MTNITNIEQQLAELTTKVALLKEENEQKYVLTKNEMVQLMKNLNEIFLEKLDESIRNVNFDNHFEIDVEYYGNSIELNKNFDEGEIADEITNSVNFIDNGDDEIIQTIDNELKRIRHNSSSTDMMEPLNELAFIGFATKIE